MSGQALSSKAPHLRRAWKPFQKYTTVAKPAGDERKWVVIDADGLVLGRLASQIALRLRGKHLPHFTPGVDCGDQVIVVNAEKVCLTGDKRQQKTYFRHTGFIGGIKQDTAAKVLDGRFPERVIQKAVERMLPRGPLGRRQFSHLHIYKGGDHPHRAQMPVTLNLAAMNPKNSPKSQGAVRMPDVREQRDDKGLWVNVDVGQEATISAHTLSDDAKKPITIFWTGEGKVHSIEEFFERNAPKTNKAINAIAFTNTNKLTFENLSSLAALQGKLPEGITFLRLESIAESNANSDFIAWSTIGRIDRVGVLLKVNRLRDIEGEVCNFIANTHSRPVQADAARRGIDKIIRRLGPAISSP